MKVTVGFATILGLAAALLSPLSLTAQTPSTTAAAAYLNPMLPIDQRVDDLVSRMTLAEKASQVVNEAAAIPRLQVPGYNWWSESLHGTTVGLATVFPEPIGLAATFDVPLIHDVATAIGIENRATYHEVVRQGAYYAQGLDFWAPNLNIFRDPRWGRGQETYGEDPYLTGRMGVAYVTGMQGDDPKYFRVIATPKHYAVHSGPEPLRHIFDVDVSRHDIEDTYLPAFRAAVVEGKADSVMCVYNSVNGEPGCANPFLLQETLRDKWKFQGYVVSDCDAVADVYRGHHYTNSLAEASAISLRRGTDLDCNGFGGRGAVEKDSQGYVDAVKQGLLKESELDVSVKRLMRARFQLGMFDPPEKVAYTQIPYSVVDSEEHRQLALKTARESLVLLKNRGILPLKADIHRIAVVGPLADQVDVLLGNYNGTPSRATSVLQGIQKQFPSAKVSFSAGTDFLRGSDPIPRSAFMPKGKQAGLQGQFFKGIELQGAPVLTRTDAQIDFDFTGKDLVPAVGKENFSARWTGVLVAPVSGTYALGATGDDGYRLWVDGTLVVENWGIHPPSTKTAEVKLVKGHRYAIKLEYFQAEGGAVLQLVWVKPGRDHELLQQAVTQARTADVVVAVVGISSELEGEEMNVDVPGFKGGDRTSLDLPKPEEDLLKALKATAKPLVVVLMNGSALSVNWAEANADAILDAWYSGEEGGQAVAQTLAGDNNPAGRLAVTFYKGVNQLPLFEDYSMAKRTYRYFDGQPLYQFGFGLSYSTFAYSGLKLSSSQLKAGETLSVDADVRNTSGLAGDEVVQLYLSFPTLSGAPLRALRGFSRVHLGIGESRHVHFVLGPRDLSMVDRAGVRHVAAGSYGLSVGGGQPGTGAALADARFSIEGDQVLPD